MITVIAPTTAALVTQTGFFSTHGSDQEVTFTASGLGPGEEIVPYIGGSGPWTPIFEDGLQVKLNSARTSITMPSGVHYGFTKTVTAAAAGLDAAFGDDDLIGPQGPQGPAGPAGTAGRTVLNGTSDPTLALGAVGDFYLRTDTNRLFGPKTADAWGLGISLVGPSGPTGPAGADGAAGPAGPAGDSAYQVATDNGFVGDEPAWLASLVGPQGPEGPAGAAGRTVLSGTVDPTTEGADGDFYIRTDTSTLFGPKASGAWGSGTSLIGPTGATGSTGSTGPAGDSAYVVATNNGFVGDEPAWLASLVGPTGPAGAAGNTVRSSSGVPGAGTGVDGDFNIDTTTYDIYGPKTAGAWGAGTSLVGPQGIQGPAGADGATGPAGPAGLNGVIENYAGFDPVIVAYFDRDGDTEGWDGGSGTLTVANGEATFTVAGGGSGLILDGTAFTQFNGRDYPLVKAKVTRTAGDPSGTGWRGWAMFETTTRSGFAHTNSEDIANPVLEVGVPQVLTWDMRDLTNSTVGPTEWMDGVITGLRLDLNNATPHAYTIDWIAIGREAPSAAFYAGSGASIRPTQQKLREIEVSVIDFGADPTGVADSTQAFRAALDSDAYNIHVPAGTYTITNLVVDKYVKIFGSGRARTIIQVTTTTDHGIVLQGSPDFYENGAEDVNLIGLESLTFRYTGAGQPAGKHGVLVRVKTHAAEVLVDGFTNTGIYTTSYLDETDPLANSRTPFFMHFEDVWSKNNGEDGMQNRWGSNANLFVNCIFDKNGRYGFYHHTGISQGDGIGTYGSTIIGGQCSYNTQEGWRFETGTNLTVLGIYAEGNGRDAGGNAYTNTLVDFYCHSPKSFYQIGTLFNGDSTHIDFDNGDRTVDVRVGGTRKNAAMVGVSKTTPGSNLATVEAKVNELLDALANAKITNFS